MSELRKVVFRLDNTEYGFFDHTDNERRKVEELQKSQEGFSHRWGDKIVTDEKTGVSLQKTVAFVEDSKGEIYQIDLKSTQFKES